MKKLIVASGYAIRDTDKSSYKAMREVITTSRIQYSPDLYDFKLMCEKIQDIPKSPKKFEDCCEERVRTLEKLDHPIYVLWSGGIDSTGALTSIYKYGSAELKKRVTVLANLYSLKEYSELFPFILKNFKVDSSFKPLAGFAQKGYIITGELGDQLFGSDLIFDLVPLFGEEALDRPYSEILPLLFKDRAGEKTGSKFYNRYSEIVNEAPFKIQTTFDFLWWWNFSQKWQHVKYRLLLNGIWENPRLGAERILHFYDSPHFQSWSIQNHDQKIKGGLAFYKQILKEQIVSVTGHQFYLKKMKIGSLGYIWFGREAHFALDEDFNYVAPRSAAEYRKAHT